MISSFPRFSLTRQFDCSPPAVFDIAASFSAASLQRSAKAASVIMDSATPWNRPRALLPYQTKFLLDAGGALASCTIFVDASPRTRTHGVLGWSPEKRA